MMMMMTDADAKMVITTASSPPPHSKPPLLFCHRASFPRSDDDDDDEVVDDDDGAHSSHLFYSLLSSSIKKTTTTSTRVPRAHPTSNTKKKKTSSSSSSSHASLYYQIRVRLKKTRVDESLLFSSSSSSFKNEENCSFYSLLSSLRMMKRTKEYTCEIIIIELKREREMKSLWLRTRRPLCAQNAQKDASKSIFAKREKKRETVSSSFAGKKGEHITAALFFHQNAVVVRFLNETNKV